MAAYDLDPAAISTFIHNLPSSGATVADLSGDYLDSLDLRPDAVVAGPPCQGFSPIGPNRSRDIRNELLLKPVDFAIAVKARVLLIENVRGVLSRRHASRWQEALSRLRKNGYTTATLQVAAVRNGLAQIRRRVVLVAARRGFNPPSQSTPTISQPLRSILTVPRNLTNHDPQPLDPTSRAARIAAHISPGQKLSNVRNGATSIHTWDIPEVFGPTTKLERRVLQALLVLRRRHRRRPFGDADPVPFSTLTSEFGTSTKRLLMSLIEKRYVRRVLPDCYDLRGTFNGKFRRLDPNQPALCVLSTFCDPRHFLHPFETRGFTIREAARLQGFPDSFRFLGSIRQQAVQVGNAVPPPVAHMLAAWMRDHLL